MGYIIVAIPIILYAIYSINKSNKLTKSIIKEMQEDAKRIYTLIMED